MLKYDVLSDVLMYVKCYLEHHLLIVRNIYYIQ